MSVSRFKKSAALAAFVAGAASFGPAAHGQTIKVTEVPYTGASFTSLLGSAPALLYVDPLSGQTILPGVTAKGGAEVNGAVADKYATPDGLGKSQTYLVGDPGTSPSDSVTLSYATAQTSITLLWGSIDTYNTLTLSNGTRSVRVTGAELLPAARFDSNGNSIATDPTGQTALVTISNLGLGSGFTTAVFSSSQAAFEFTFVAPEPASLAMSGTALLAVTGVTLRRRKAKV